MSIFGFLAPTAPALIVRSTDPLAEMLETAETMFHEAARCLLDNEAVGLDLKALDETVNAGEREIRRSVLEHKAVNPADDLSHSLRLLSVVQDAERCGDLAKSLAKASALAERPRTGRHVEALRTLRDHVVAIYPLTIQSLRDGDASLAREVMDVHHAARADVAVFLRGLAAADDLTLNEGVVLTLGAQTIARVSSHLSNVASAVAMPFDLVRTSPLAA